MFEWDKTKLNTTLDSRKMDSAYVAAAGCCSNASLGSLGTGGFFLAAHRGGGGKKKKKEESIKIGALKKS